ncbi:alpha/beta hydrolase [Pendulispora albinea]|uniref:Esterase n=1 Tax=Pendulispora albinea TaxID=2741071 RepID=A0ABZ2M702_9BACT
MRFMRLLPAALLTMLVGCSSAADDAASPADTQAASNPLQAARTTVRVHYPAAAHTLTLTTDRAPVATTDRDNDTREFSFADVSGALSVKPMLGDVPARGPHYTVRAGQTLDIYPHFFEKRGRVSTRWPHFKSKVHPQPGGMGRPIEVYLPPSYEENPTARFPVIYMMDSQIVFGNSILGTTVMGDMLVDEAMDAAAESGAIAESIVVGIVSPISPCILDPMEDRNLELTPTKAVDPTGSVRKSGDGPKFVSMLVNELKPLVDRELRTRPARESTFIGGASLGGLMSVYAGVTRGDVFGGIVSLSASAFWDERVAARMVRSAKTGPNQTLKVYADIGGGEVYPDTDIKDMMVVTNEDLFQAYADAGYVEGKTLMALVTPVREPGKEHNGKHWAKRIPSALAFVVGPGR